MDMGVKPLNCTDEGTRFVASASLSDAAVITLNDTRFTAADNPSHQVSLISINAGNPGCAFQRFQVA
jgi:hypothetical protein